MSYFYYKKDELFCENVSLNRLAREIGTPFYVYSYKTVLENLKKIKKAFSPLNPLVCYSLKANTNLTICKILALQGAGADVVSGGELYQALKAGFSPEKIVYSGVGKTPQEIEFALKKQILFLNVESEEEFFVVSKIAKKLDLKAPISFRINPDVDSQTHRYVTTAKKENKFGISLIQAERLYQRAFESEHVEIRGIHMHIGSQILSLEPYLKALSKIIQLIDKLQSRGIKIQFLDIGGGFGIKYQEEEKEFPLESFSESLISMVPSQIRLILEPGRYIVGSAGALITELLYRKKEHTDKFFIVDAGMNDLIRPSLYGAYHRIVPLKRKIPSQEDSVNIVGPVCESGDFFAHNRKIPSLNQQDLLAILDAGAYGFSMSSNYNGRTRPPEVLVKEEHWWLIREREDYLDLMRKQRIPVDFSLYGKKLDDAYFPLEFWKMEGSGNDFIIVDNRGKIIQDGGELARKVCQRKKNIGADGLILIEKANKADFIMRIFNPDGSEAEMCGNGARCAAFFAYKKRIAGKECSIQTLAGKIQAKIRENKVKVKMREPSGLRKNITLEINGKNYSGFHVNTGVPHFVIFWEPIDGAPVKEVGPKIRFHQMFLPHGTNVDFVEIKDQRIIIRTYERGVEDETLACGTGAVASALVSHLTHKIPPPVRVKMRGGEVSIWFNFEEEKFSDVYLEGEVNLVYTGYLNGGWRYV